MTRMRKHVVLLLLLFLQITHAQVVQPCEPTPIDEFSAAIEDNSFFIEEAYNQGPGVVQHIFGGTSFTSPQKEVILGFTQEWPVGSRDHQFSFTVPYYLLNSNTFSGIGDVLVNYRYQLCSSDDWAALAPRVSIEGSVWCASKPACEQKTGRTFGCACECRGDHDARSKGDERCWC